MDLGIAASTAIWQNTDVSYDVALGGQPFIYAINDARPYIRQTAPFKKEQFDNGQEPGEQSLTGWWIRSQSSFHGGDGIKFYDPSSGENVANRFADSENVNVWTKGQVTLLRNVNTITAGYPAAGLRSSGRSTHYTSSIKWTVAGVTYEGVLDGGDYNIVRITSTGTVQPLVASTDTIYAIANDGEFVYWITNTVSGTSKMHMWKKSINAAVGDASTLMFNDSLVIIGANLTYTKERLIAGIQSTTNSAVYEIPTNSTALPTDVYQHPSKEHVWTSATSSGTAIYVSGWNGILSSIVKFTLNASGVMPVLTSAITAAEMPTGERIYSIRHYLDKLMIGTNKGIRAANVLSDGSLEYGPLIVETTQPVFGFAARDRFVWCASGTTNGKQGLIRIDLGTEIESLRFAYANDIQTTLTGSGAYTVSVGFLGETDQVFFSNASSEGVDVKTISNKARTDGVATLTTSTEHGYVVGEVIYVTVTGDTSFNSTAGFPPGSHKTVLTVPSTTTFTYTNAGSDVASTAATGTVFVAGSACWESPAELTTNGYLDTGNIRYNTLEPKNFKRLRARGDYSYGSMTLYTIENSGDLYDQISYDASVGTPEINTLQPAGQQEYLSYKFQLFRDADDNTKGPVFTGYQAKATIATPRQRIIQFPIYCFDVETDRYNSLIGYQGRALERLSAIENIEANGDIVNWQDLTTGETRQVVIEQIQFTRMTPPDKRFDGFGGIIEIVVRTV
jgi:hypothetical protein